MFNSGVTICSLVNEMFFGECFKQKTIESSIYSSTVSLPYLRPDQRAFHIPHQYTYEGTL